MNRIVVAFESEKSRSRITEMLETSGFPVRAAFRSGAEAKRMIMKMGGGIVVCGHKLPDMTADELIYDLGALALVLVMAKPVFLDMCESPDLFRLTLPTSRQELSGSLRMLMQLDERQQRMTVPQRKDDDRQMIESAKRLLIAREGVTEEQAHRLIQRRSMDTGAKMADTAKKILESY